MALGLAAPHLVSDRRWIIEIRDGRGRRTIGGTMRTGTMGACLSAGFCHRGG
jgi:hypothetical protein